MLGDRGGVQGGGDLLEDGRRRVTEQALRLVHEARHRFALGALRLLEPLARIPAERWRSPDDMAGAVAFLASADAAYVHRIVLTVDGGWMGR